MRARKFAQVLCSPQKGGRRPEGVIVRPGRGTYYPGHLCCWAESTPWGTRGGCTPPKARGARCATLQQAPKTGKSDNRARVKCGAFFEAGWRPRALGALIAPSPAATPRSIHRVATSRSKQCATPGHNDASAARSYFVEAFQPRTLFFTTSSPRRTESSCGRRPSIPGTRIRYR